MNLTVELALSLLGGIIGLAGFAWGIVSWVVSQFQKRDEQIDALREALNRHMLYSAQHYATADTLKEAVEKVTEAVTRVTERLDRYFEHRPPHLITPP